MTARAEYLLTQIFNEGFNEDEVVIFSKLEGSQEYFLRLLLRALMINDDISKIDVYVIVRRFPIFNDQTYTLRDIGEELNITEARVRQIEAKTLRKLRNPDRMKKLLKTYTTKEEFEKACLESNNISKDEFDMCLRCFA